MARTAIDVLQETRRLIAAGWNGSGPTREIGELEADSPAEVEHQAWLWKVFGERETYPRHVLCDALHPYASRFDLLGALDRAAEGDQPAHSAAIQALDQVVPCRYVFAWANGKEQAETIAMLDLAISRLKRVAA